MAGFNNPDQMYSGNGVVSRGLKKISALFGNNDPAAAEPIWNFSQPINAVKNWDARNRTMDIMNPSGTPEATASITTITPSVKTPLAPISNTSGVVPTSVLNPAPAVSAGITRRAPVRNAAVKPPAITDTATPLPEVSNDGMQTPGEQVAGTNNITRIDNVGAGQSNSDYGPKGIASLNVPVGGGFASNGNESFALRGRTPAEDAAYQEQQAVQPISTIAQLPQPQTTTYGDSSGVYQLAPGQNPPPDVSKMSLGDMAAYKFGVNQQVKQAGIANLNSEITNRQATTQLATNLQPSQINLNNASARHANVSADLGIAKAPAEIANINAVTAQHTALANESNKLLDLKGKNMISEIDYRNGMLSIGNKKLDLLSKQYDARLAAMKQTTADPDYKLIADIAKSKIKTYQDMSALGALTPTQVLDWDKQNKTLDIVQRHATKKTAQYNGGNGLITDEES